MRAALLVVFAAAFMCVFAFSSPLPSSFLPRFIYIILRDVHLRRFVCLEFPAHKIAA